MNPNIDLKSQAPLQTNLEDEPKLASDIIREMFNRLEDDYPQR